MIEEYQMGSVRSRNTFLKSHQNVNTIAVWYPSLVLGGQKKSTLGELKGTKELQILWGKPPRKNHKMA